MESLADQPRTNNLNCKTNLIDYVAKHEAFTNRPLDRHRCPGIQPMHTLTLCVNSEDQIRIESDFEDAMDAHDLDHPEGKAR